VCSRCNPKKPVASKFDRDALLTCRCSCGVGSKLPKWIRLSESRAPCRRTAAAPVAGLAGSSLGRFWSAAVRQKTDAGCVAGEVAVGRAVETPGARHLRNQARADEIQPASRVTLQRRSSAQKMRLDSFPPSQGDPATRSVSGIRAQGARSASRFAIIAALDDVRDMRKVDAWVGVATWGGRVEVRQGCVRKLGTACRKNAHATAGNGSLISIHHISELSPLRLPAYDLAAQRC
jgi:hypothetical protein